MVNHFKNLKQIIKVGNLKEQVDICGYTTMKIGGKARYLVETGAIEEIGKLLVYCEQHNLPIFVLGGGSNVVFSDQGFAGVILKLQPQPFKLLLANKVTTVEFVAGYPSSLAASKMADLGLSGFECLFGLPGTLGGAVYQNSKWPKDNYQISDSLLSVTYFNRQGQLLTKLKTQLKFSYGYSCFQKDKDVIVKMVFSFSKKPPEKIKAKMQEVMAYRLASQPHGVFTAGCVFKNPGKQSAGFLLDQVGLKKQTQGKIVVSPVHANFFVNKGTASAEDYLAMVKLAKQKVKNRFNIDLKEEVEFVK